MFNNFKSMLTICLLAFASMQTAQAVAVDGYGFTNAVNGTPTSTSPASFLVTNSFSVISGSTYVATLTDHGNSSSSATFDNFDSLYMYIHDESHNQVGLFLTLEPTSGSGEASVSFDFTALYDTTYSMILGGFTDAISIYTATITPVAGDPVTSVPVPGAIWLLGTGMFALVGFGRRKSV